MFCVYVFGSSWYFFQLIVLLQPDFNCWSNFALSWVNKVKSETQSFVSVIANLPLPAELVIIQGEDHVKKD